MTTPGQVHTNTASRSVSRLGEFAQPPRIVRRVSCSFRLGVFHERLSTTTSPACCNAFCNYCGILPRHSPGTPPMIPGGKTRPTPREDIRATSSEDPLGSSFPTFFELSQISLNSALPRSATITVLCFAPLPASLSHDAMEGPRPVMSAPNSQPPQCVFSPQGARARVAW